MMRPERISAIHGCDVWYSMNHEFSLIGPSGLCSSTLYMGVNHSPYIEVSPSVCTSAYVVVSIGTDDEARARRGAAARPAWR